MQLNLKLQPKLSYDGSTFLIHQGFTHICDSVRSLLESKKFQILVVEGSKRVGKTHLSLWVAKQATEKGLYTRLIEDLKCFDPQAVLSNDSVTIIDDFDHLKLEDSGAFVHLVESLRVSGGKLVVLIGCSPDVLEFDEHVISRLKPGFGYKIGLPSTEEIPELLSRMAMQRGVKLRARSLSYLVKRIPLSPIDFELYIEELRASSETKRGAIPYSSLSRLLNGNQS